MLKAPKEWFSRGYLPHLDHPGLLQAVTFRLADSLPSEVMEGLRSAGVQPAKDKSSDAGGKPALQKIEDCLDAGHGACLLRIPENAETVENALLRFDGQRYGLIAWTIMPNHVHALIETREGYPLSGIVHSWKSFTASAINRRMGRSGEFWQREYFDRYVRSDEHLAVVVAYIENNPVKAGLAQSAKDWTYGSAWTR
jgi:putative DNA methylase